MYSAYAFHGCLYNQALADVRSTVLGIKCPYCMYVCFSVLVVLRMCVCLCVCVCVCVCGIGKFNAIANNIHASLHKDN